MQGRKENKIATTHFDFLSSGRLSDELRYLFHPGGISLTCSRVAAASGNRQAESFMPLVLFHTRRVREALKSRTGLAADLVFLLFASAIVGVGVMMGRQVYAP